MNSLYDVLKLLVPISLDCPYVRIGGFGDGAYVLPDDLIGVKTCISPGVCNSKVFEDEIETHYGIGSVLIDYSSDEHLFSTPLSRKQVFLKKWLSPNTSENSVTINDVISTQGLQDQELLLQMDIEGHEYENILSCPRAALEQFRIICIELHHLQELRYPQGKFGELISRTLLKIGQTHACVYVHANNVVSECRMPGTNLLLPPLLECTFIRRDRLQVYAHSRPLQLPHPLDILNVPSKPSINLDRFFTSPLLTALRNPLILLPLAIYRPVSRIVCYLSRAKSKVFASLRRLFES